MNRNDSGLIVQRGANVGIIQAFMAQVYGWMTVGLLLTAFVAWYTAGSETLREMIYSNSSIVIGLVIAQFALVIGISWALNKISAAMATAMFMLYSLLTGVTLSIVFVVYTSSSIASTFVVTAGTFGAMSVYGYVTKRDLTKLGSFFFMGLIGLILASVVNLFMQSPALTWAITYAGVLIFVGLTAYDTQYLKNLGEQIAEDDHENLRKYAIYGALKLYLDFINLFLYLLRILGDRR